MKLLSFNGTDLHSNLVPRNLKQEQKDMRRDRCIDFLESIENDPLFLEHVITGDDTWVFWVRPGNQVPERGMAHTKLPKAIF